MQDKQGRILCRRFFTWGAQPDGLWFRVLESHDGHDSQAGEKSSQTCLCVRDSSLSFALDAWALVAHF